MAKKLIILKICFILGRVNVEIRKYIREEFQVTYGKDSMDFNMIGALFQVFLRLQTRFLMFLLQECSESIVIKYWIATYLWSFISILSIIMFFVLARLVHQNVGKRNSTFSDNSKVERSNYEFEQKDFKISV